MYFFFFFFNDTATTEIYTLSLHDALPICMLDAQAWRAARLVLDTGIHAYGWGRDRAVDEFERWSRLDRKSTRLNSSHANISYAVFCLKKKKKNVITFAFQLLRLLRLNHGV